MRADDRVRIAKVILETDIPDHVSAIPALLKYGVPTPEAAWIQGAGIRARRLSIALAQRFRQTNLTRTPAAVRRWLLQLDPDEFMAEYGVSPAVAASAARVIFRSNRSDLLDRYEGGQLLPHLVQIRLSRTAVELGSLDDVRIGAAVTLERDYSSQINRNAIVATIDGARLGYLPWEWSEVLAVELDSGQAFLATVEATDAASNTMSITYNRHNSPYRK